MKMKRRKPSLHKLALRTEIMVNLNVLNEPGDAELKTMNPMPDGLCPPELELRARGLRMLLRKAAPSIFTRIQAPFCGFCVHDSGMVTIRTMSMWQDRRPVCVALASQNEVMTASYLKKVSELIAHPERMLMSIMNDEKFDGNPYNDEDYWGGTEWEKLPVFTGKLFREFGERFTYYVTQIPTSADKRIDRLAVFGDDRWLHYVPGTIMRVR